MNTEQRAFYDACNKLRGAWGNRNSTFEKICHLIANVITTSTKDGVDQEKAASQIEYMWWEWVNFRCFFFMMKSPKKISATITKWPNGNHFYVKIHGIGVLIEERFNTQPEAQKFLNKHVKNLKAEGFELIQSVLT